MARPKPQQADLIIDGGMVLTMDPDRSLIDGGAVVITGNRIEAVGQSGDLRERYQASRVIDASNKLVMPGFINTHTHILQILLRGGLSQDRELYDWMFNVLYPGLAQYSVEEARLATYLYCMEAIRSGITTIVENADQGRSDDIAVATIRALQEIGLRAVYARLFFDFTPDYLAKTFDTIIRKAPTVKQPKDLMESGPVAIAHTVDLIKRFDGSADGRIHVWPAPALPLTTTDEALMASAQLAADHEVMVTVHHAEAPLDARMYEMTTTEYLHAIGFLSPRVLAAHCVWLNDRDIRLLKLHDVKVAHNPVSNLFLAAGIAPISKMVTQGVTVSLGSDDANSNENANLFQEMKIAALLQRGINLDPSSLTAEKVVEMATIDGARCVGLESEIGSLEPGKKADVIVVGLHHPQLWPMHHIPNMLVFQAHGCEVESTIVDGRVLMEDRRLTFVEEGTEAEIYRSAQEAARRIAEAAGLEGLDRGWRTFGW